MKFIQQGKMTAQIAFTIGILLSPLAGRNSTLSSAVKAAIPYLLQVSIVFQGASLDFNKVMSVGVNGFVITFLSLLAIFILGHIGAKFLKLEREQSLLITMGTAICGGSAIAALAPVIAASAGAIAIAMGLVFLLNIFAIFSFPFIGHYFELSQADFGLWAALSIHDTSSVTAAAAAYGTEALSVATTVKLTRALWIIPVTFFFSYLKKESKKAMKVPWFILGFIIASILFTYSEFLKPYSSWFGMISKFGFTLTLFLIGLNFDLPTMKKIALRPLIFGLSLWLIVSIASLIFITSF